MDSALDHVLCSFTRRLPITSTLTVLLAPPVTSAKAAAGSIDSTKHTAAKAATSARILFANMLPIMNPFPFTLSPCTRSAHTPADACSLSAHLLDRQAV